MVAEVRKKVRTTMGHKNIKVGHAGTLDPFATGLLIVGIGREATRRLDEFKKLSKTYVATLRLGAVSDTGDPTGKIRITHNVEHGTSDNGQVMRSTLRVPETPSKQTILNVLQTLLGPQLQTPPMHSAKQVGGVRLYKLARQGKTIARQPNKIEILNIKMLGYSWPTLKIEVACSPGTYIRALAEDIGQKLGAGAFCADLERTKIGPYDLSNAQAVDAIDWNKVTD